MLSKFSVKRPMTILVAVFMILVLAVVSFFNMKTDLLPNIDLPYVMVITTYVGASPEKVEQEVTKPLESALSTVSGMDQITSTSSENYSMVVLKFTYGTKMDTVMVDLNSKLSTVSAALPDSAGAPTMTKLSSDMIPVMVSSVSYKGSDLAGLSNYVNETVVPALERVDGVAAVTPHGLFEKQLVVELDQNKIDALNEKIVAVTDQKLASALAKLQQGEQALALGEQQLTATKKEQSQKLASAGIAIADGKTAIAVGAASMDSALTQAQSTLKLLKSLQEVLAKLGNADQLLARLESLSGTLTQTGGQLESLGGELGKITDSVKNLKVDEIDWTALELLVKDSPEGQAALQQLRGQLSGMLGEDGSLQKTLAGLSQSSSQLGSQMKHIGATIEPANIKQIYHNLVEQLNTAVSGLETTIAKLPEQKKQLLAKRDALTKQQETVEQAKMLLSVELAGAGEKLNTTKSELTKARAELESSTTAAAKAVGLDGLFSTSSISAILKAQNFSMPAGYLKNDTEQYAVKVGDTLADPDEVRSLVLFSSDIKEIGTVTLSDVATLQETDNTESRYAKVNGQDGILLQIQKQNTASTAEVSKALRSAMDKMKTADTKLGLSVLMDQGVYIDLVIAAVLENLAMGGILAILILFLFLRSPKPTFIVALSIPVSLLLAVVLMYFSGVNLNIISLAGLALGVGMLVDNSIVVIENTYRLRMLGMDPAKAAVKGASQVAGAIAASTLTTICVFLPIVFTTGISKELFTDMGLTIAYSLLASLLIALTLVPALSSTILRKAKMPKAKRPSLFMRGYEGLLRFSLRVKVVPVLLVLALMGLSVFGAFHMGTAFIPESSSDQLSITLKMDRKTEQKAMRAETDRLMAKIMTVPNVETVGAMESSGSGGAGFMAGGSSSSGDKTTGLYVVLKEKKTKSRNDVINEIKKAVADAKGEVSVASTTGMTGMLASGISVELRGNDLDTLRNLAGQVATQVKATGGTTEVNDGLGEPVQEIRVTVDKAKAMKYSLTVAQIYQQIASIITDSVTATTVDTDQLDIAVQVKKAAANLTTKDTLADSLVSYTDATTNKTGTVKLGEIATIATADSLSSIGHDNLVRIVTVSAQVKDGNNIGLVSRQLEENLKKVTVPEGYSLQITGENETINTTLRDVLFMVLLAIVMIYGIMVIQFQSLRGPFIVLFTIPLAFTGGLLALWAFGMDLSVMSVLGFLVLAGVVVNNAIVFVDTANQLRAQGMDRREALVETGKMRMRPIMMTALTTILGLSTIAMGYGNGAEMLQPMAVVIIFGLLYATLLTLIIVPVLYDLFQRKLPRVVHLDDDDLPNTQPPSSDSCNTPNAPGAPAVPNVPGNLLATNMPGVPAASDFTCAADDTQPDLEMQVSPQKRDFPDFSKYQN